MGNQQSVPDGSPAPPPHHPNPPSHAPIRSRQPSNAASNRNAVGYPSTSPSTTTIDPALLAEYQRLRKEILDDPAFSNDALLPFEDEPSSDDTSLLNLSTSTPWSKPLPSQAGNKQKGYRVPDTSGYYDDSGTTFNDIVDTRRFPPPGPPSPPISASYATRPKQAAAIGTGGYQTASTTDAAGRARAATDASVGRGGGGQTRDGANARASVSPPLLPPGMPVRVNQNGDAVVDLVLEDGTPLQLRQAKRQFDRDKFKRANQQAAGEAPSPPAATAAPSSQRLVSAACKEEDGPDPHTIPLPNSPLKPASEASPRPPPAAVPTAGPPPPSHQPRIPSATGGLSDTDEALMDEILRLV